MYSLEEVRKVDPEIAALIEEEVERQNNHIELIASENWTSKAVMSAMGSPLTDSSTSGPKAEPKVATWFARAPRQRWRHVSRVTQDASFVTNCSPVRDFYGKIFGSCQFSR